MNVETDAARILGDLGAVLQRVKDAFHRIILQHLQVAAAHLGAGRAGVEERRGGVSECLAAHQIVGGANALQTGGCRDCIGGGILGPFQQAGRF